MSTRFKGFQKDVMTVFACYNKFETVRGMVNEVN